MANNKEVDKKLLKFVNEIKDKELRNKVRDVLEDPSIIIAGNKITGLPLWTSPASKKHHHSYPKGLLQHIAAVSALGTTLSDLVEQTYGTPVNRDVVLASTLLHDIMKPLTYTQEDAGYGTSPLGERLDHLSLAVAELVRRGFPLEIIHAVAAHHGKSGPSSPKTIEALICSLSDELDASLNGEVLDAARYLIHDCVGADVKGLSAEEAFRIVRAKQEKGCSAVTELFRKIMSDRSEKE
jgi:7,8-dihydroneopterin 2',3'-cyclic phosphate phosphodiesterase